MTLSQRYKLHLSDGTVLEVDHDALSTWLVDRKAMVQVGRSNLWLPLKEFLAAERVAAFRASPRRTARTRAELPLIPPPPRKGEQEPPRAEPVGGAPFEQPPAEPAAAPSGTPQPTVRTREEPPLTPPPRWEPLAPAPIGQPRGVDVLAAEPVVPSRKPALPPAMRPDDSAPPIPLVPLDEAPLTPAVPLAKESRPKPQAEAFVPSAPGHLDADAEELPLIPLKPLDEQDRERSPKISWAARDEAYETQAAGGWDERWDEEAGPQVLLRPADVAFLRAAARLGGFLSHLLDSLGRAERGWQARRAAVRRASAARRAAEATPADDEPESTGEPRTLGELLALAVPKRVPAPKPVDETPRPPFAADAPRASGETRVPEPPRVFEATRALEPPARVLKPPSLGELPVLRLAERPEQESAGDLYEGEDVGERPGLLHGVWIWTKRLVVVAVLVGGGILAALTWQTWFPKAGELGEQALTGIDRQVRSKEIESARQQLLEEASEQLPQLAPETIALLLSRRPDDVPDLPALFQAATDAVARGRVSLTSTRGAGAGRAPGRAARRTPSHRASARPRLRACS